MSDQLERAVQFLENNDYLGAEHLLNQIKSEDKTYPQALSYLSTIAYQHGHIDKSLEFTLKALSIDTTNEIEYKIGLATIYKELKQKDKSINILTELYQKYPTNNQVLFLYANALLLDEQFNESLKIFQKLNSLCENDPQILLSLGINYREVGDVDNAKKIFLEIIKIDKGYVLAYINLISITKYKKEMFPIDDPLLLSKSIALTGAVLCSLENAIGAVYEQIGDYKKSFAFYNKANDRMSEKVKEIPKNQYDYISNIEKVYTPELLSNFKSNSFCPLIFIFGMPRSGSTLLEQILITNNEVETKGEMKAIFNELFDFKKRISNDSSGKTFPEDYKQLSIDYLNKRIGKINTKFCIDKMPGNFRYIGLMYLLFPNAKFIYTKRNPMDVCFSGWTTNYAEGHYYSYDLTTMAREYKEHQRLINHWNKILPPGTIHTVEYESVISNFEKTITSMCSHIGINYTNDMKNFHKIKRKVKTASVGQVTEPLYSSSVNRSNKYGTLLDPLKKALYD